MYSTSCIAIPFRKINRRLDEITKRIAPGNDNVAQQEDDIIERTKSPPLKKRLRGGKA
jgi:hypothetical protein